tara:strand:- start:1062 stop:1349 length:288 start_codon:yes stop_codon:yes gene_type:complete
MIIKESNLRKIIRDILLEDDSSNGNADQAYVGPYVVAGTEAPSSDTEDENEQMCDQLGSQLISLNKQLQAPGADVQSIQKQIELVTKTQTQTCEK